MTPLRIVFAGTPEFGLPCLDALYNTHHTIVGVYTQPDRPAGRGQTLQASPIKQKALQYLIPVYQPDHFKSEDTRATLRALKPDVMVVVAYGLLLPQSVLDIPRYGCINVHASLLPRWRGASPIQHAILAGDAQSGITIMRMEAGLDTGPMLRTSACSITQDMNAMTLHNTLAEIAPPALLEVLAHLDSMTLTPVLQDNTQATYAPKIHKEDARIIWSQPMQHIDRTIRAFNPWPVAFTFFEERRLKILAAETSTRQSNAEPGTICDITRDGLAVATGDYILHLTHIQFEGKKAMPVSEWINSIQRNAWIGQCFH